MDSISKENEINIFLPEKKPIYQTWLHVYRYIETFFPRLVSDENLLNSDDDQWMDSFKLKWWFVR